MGFQMLRFRSKADKVAREAHDTAGRSEDVGIFDQSDRKLLLVFFDFLRGDRGRSVVGNSGTENGDVISGDRVSNGVEHLLSRFDRDEIDPIGDFEGCRSRDQQHLMVQPSKSASKRVAHAPRRTIAEESDRVDGLARGASGDEDFHGAGRKELRIMVVSLVWLVPLREHP
ncbi:MAG: hypothetical protein RL117_1260 [Verrucomicrobiota bacterium]